MSDERDGRRTSDAPAGRCAYCGQTEGHSPRCAVTRLGAEELRALGGPRTPEAEPLPGDDEDEACAPARLCWRARELVAEAFGVEEGVVDKTCSAALVQLRALHRELRGRTDEPRPGGGSRYTFDPMTPAAFEAATAGLPEITLTEEERAAVLRTRKRIARGDDFPTSPRTEKAPSDAESEVTAKLEERVRTVDEICRWLRDEQDQVVTAERVWQRFRVDVADVHRIQDDARRSAKPRCDRYFDDTTKDGRCLHEAGHSGSCWFEQSRGEPVRGQALEALRAALAKRAKPWCSSRTVEESWREGMRDAIAIVEKCSETPATVWLVQQSSSSYGYDPRTVAVCSTEARAKALAERMQHETKDGVWDVERMPLDEKGGPT